MTTVANVGSVHCSIGGSSRRRSHASVLDSVTKVHPRDPTEFTHVDGK